MILLPEYFVSTEINRRLEHAHGSERRRTVRPRRRRNRSRSEHPTT
ncbi:hypothetical protein [Mumia sp. DW29H23]